MGMFGNRSQAFGQIPGMGMMPPQMQRAMAQPGAMQPNTQAMTKKPGFFSQGQPGRQIVGILGDTLATLGGGQGVYMPAMLQQQQQDAEIRARLQAALEKRKADREDKQWEWDNKPDEERAPYRWESNDGSLMEVGPDGLPRQVYKDPTPKTTFIMADNGDGTKAVIPVINGVPQIGQGPPAPQRPVGKLRPIGGQPGGNGPFVP